MDNSSPAFTLASSAFKDCGVIPDSYTHKGDNTNPPLSISGVPAQAKSLALIMHDPDAVSGDFLHWLVWDIRADTQGINANAVPVGAIQGPNGMGANKYLGPAPPAGTGTHRYIFELYALDTSPGLEAASDRAALEKAMQGHVVAQTKLTGLFDAD